MKQGHGAESDERQKQKDQAIARRKEQMKNQASDAFSPFSTPLNRPSNNFPFYRFSNNTPS